MVSERRRRADLRSRRFLTGVCPAETPAVQRGRPLCERGRAAAMTGHATPAPAALPQVSSFQFQGSSCVWLRPTAALISFAAKVPLRLQRSPSPALFSMWSLCSFVAKVVLRLSRSPSPVFFFVSSLCAFVATTLCAWLVASLLPLRALLRLPIQPPAGDGQRPDQRPDHNHPIEVSHRCSSLAISPASAGVECRGSSPTTAPICNQLCHSRVDTV